MAPNRSFKPTPLRGLAEFQSQANREQPHMASTVKDHLLSSYFPALAWEGFRSADPNAPYAQMRAQFIDALVELIADHELYLLPPPNRTDATVGSKRIGNVQTDARLEYWIASPNDVRAYFEEFWPQQESESEGFTELVFMNLPEFCFPMKKVDYPWLDGQEDFDWDEHFMFS